jgi:hypothetical protein
MLDISKTKKSLDLADWVGQTFNLCNLAVESNQIIDVDRQSMQMSLYDMFKLRSLSDKLNDMLSELSDVIPGMKNGTLPIREVKWHYGDEDDDDYDDSGYYEDYNDDGSGFDTREIGLNFVVHGFNEMEFISDNDKTIVNEAKDTANKILAEYRIMLAKLSTIAERAYKDLSRFYDSISAVDSEISEYLTDRYYSFLEAKEADIEERLVARLYEKYVDSLNEQLETRHWAAMLKDYLTIETGGLMKKIIKECFSYTHAIDISDPRISHYLSRMCEDMSEINEFFNYFLEVAILQSKVRSDIKIIRRPKTEEKVEPLPSGVVAEIRDNPELNRLFRDTLGRLLEKVGARKKWQWSHVKKVLEDDKFITKVTQTQFGRLINGILPDIKEEHVRQSVKNNPISFTAKDRGCHYREISETNTLCSVFIGIGDEFEELRNSMK